MYSGFAIKALGLNRIRKVLRQCDAMRGYGSHVGLGRYDGPIVISGISGRYPNASNISELTKRLLAGEELTSETEKRWDEKNIPRRFGFVQNIDRFDASFFNIPPRQANLMDPQIRMLLEVAFEAIIDAGINPTDLKGSRTAVFCGAYGHETSDYKVSRINREDRAYFVTAAAHYMIPGRLSFHLDLHGPSSQMCTACSSYQQGVTT